MDKGRKKMETTNTIRLYVSVLRVKCTKTLRVGRTQPEWGYMRCKAYKACLAASSFADPSRVALALPYSTPLTNEMFDK